MSLVGPKETALQELQSTYNDIAVPSFILSGAPILTISDQQGPAMSGSNVDSLPALDPSSLKAIDHDALAAPLRSRHPPRILLLYGSLRERSYSRLLAEEAGRLLRRFGCETRTFNPSGLPLVDDAPPDHPKVRELFDLVSWSEGMVWSSPERHGAMTGLMKTQIDWIPLSAGAVRPTQGKTLAVMQVCGGSQSFNAVNQMRLLGRWMRLVTIPNQSSVPKAFLEFGEDGRMKASPYYDRVVDVMEELVKFTLLTRDVSGYLTDRYSERKESAEALSARVNQRQI
jgi:arsenical resistance protein ArsH